MAYDYTTYMKDPWGQTQSNINGIYDAQQKNQMDALNQQKQQAMSGFDQQQNTNNQNFYTQRNQADTANNQNVQKMRETMAANGLNMSGENITASAGLNSQRQAAFTDIGQKQDQANAQLNQQRTDWNTQHDPQTIINSLNTERNKALYDAWNNYVTQMNQQQQFDATQALTKYQADQSMAYKNAASGFNNSAGGGGTSSAGASGPAAFQADLAAANQRGLDPSENADLSWIVQHESSFNPNIRNKNGGAFGYAQFLPSTLKEYESKTGLTTKPVDQLLMMEQYIKDRYGNAANAKKFWEANNWY